MAHRPIPLFVVQHHLATADHYDVRFEIDGVLVSWAVPKGPPTEPGIRRLAKRTGDHALAYADYEGVLSPQRRGGGIVQVWDRGTFRNTSRRRNTAVDTGAEARANPSPPPRPSTTGTSRWSSRARRSPAATA